VCVCVVYSRLVATNTDGGGGVSIHIVRLAVPLNHCMHNIARVFVHVHVCNVYWIGVPHR
jgi:hypothetical protein